MLRVPALTSESSKKSQIFRTWQLKKHEACIPSQGSFVSSETGKLSFGCLKCRSWIRAGRELCEAMKLLNFRFPLHQTASCDSTRIYDQKKHFLSNKMLSSKWLYFLPVQAQGMYLLLGSLLLPLGVWHNIVGPIKCQQLLMDISCVWCSCTFLFQDMLEDSGTQSESLWTLQLQPVVFSNPMYFKFAKFLQLQ